MENPGISGRIQMDCSSRRKFSGKKVIPFEVIPFSGFNETTEMFCTICLDYKCQASSREKAKSIPVFCKWYNSIPSLFSVPKKYQYHLTEIFHRNFRTNGKHSKSWCTRMRYPSLPALLRFSRNFSQYAFPSILELGSG